jgi:ubiquinone/menaquinone biosynthesis C-methylase UbiE
MHALPFAPGTFDAVLCAYSLGYAYAPTVFGEVAQALKPGGQYVLLDMVAKDGDRADRVLVSLGYKCYSATQLLAYAAAWGWQVQECGTPRAVFHPQIQGLADETLVFVADETQPMYGIWTQ